MRVEKSKQHSNIEHTESHMRRVDTNALLQRTGTREDVVAHPLDPPAASRGGPRPSPQDVGRQGPREGASGCRDQGVQQQQVRLDLGFPDCISLLTLFVQIRPTDIRCHSKLGDEISEEL